jgi:protein-L-isoaspartate O-methyltransferase
MSHPDMSHPDASATAADAFESRYRSTPDPWNFATSPYERLRYRETLDALSRPRYRYAFEPGCSVGELTAQLALRCDRVLATDIAPSAVDRARIRCAQPGNVLLACADLSSEIPQGPFDLIIFSEIGYYFSREHLAALVRSLTRTLDEDGEFVGVHWLGHSQDHLLHGDEVHQVLETNLGLARLKARRAPGYRIDTWVRR